MAKTQNAKPEREIGTRKNKFGNQFQNSTNKRTLLKMFSKYSAVELQEIQRRQARNVHRPNYTVFGRRSQKSRDELYSLHQDAVDSLRARTISELQGAGNQEAGRDAENQDSGNGTGKIINDVLYDHIHLSALDLAFVDHPLFQRLDGLRQLSIAHRVYKGAQHTRKGHSIGTAHLAEKWLTHLGVMGSRRAQLVKLAALLHDIGHAAFSHTFDHHVAKKLNLPEHEVRSVQLMRRINAHCLQLDQDEERFVEHVILGKTLEPHEPFWFEIVANSETGVDVDKLDYLMRDAYFCGVSVAAFQPMRIIANSKLVDGHIVFRDKVYMDLFQMCQARFYMHREVYQHPTTLILERMLVDALTDFDWSHDNTCDWTTWSDEAVLFTIRTRGTARAKQILKRIDHRTLYKRSSTTQTGDAHNADERKSENKLQSVRTFGSTNSANPLDRVRFVLKNSDDVFYRKATDVSACLPTTFVERIQWNVSS